MEPNLGAITYERKAVQTEWIPFSLPVELIKVSTQTGKDQATSDTRSPAP